ncbi:MAG TPA: S41 family peptidase [Pyrinomonadaceae bacterium]
MSSPQVGRTTFCASIITILLVISVTLGQEPARPIQSADAPTEQVLTDQQKRQKTFEIVWQTVNERFYDRNFSGVDWIQVRKRYQPLVAATTSDEQVHLLLQQMVNELHQSHFVVIPPDSIPRFVPAKKSASTRRTKDKDEGDAEDADAKETDTDLTLLLDKGNPELTERMSTGIGIDIRILRNYVVVSRVNPTSSAARAGLRTGEIIRKVNGISLGGAVARLQVNPVWKGLLRPELPRIILAGFINGPEDTIVRLSITDGRNRPRTVSVHREKLPGEMSPSIGNLPPLYTEFESRLLAGGIGYIKFDAFVPAMMRRVCAMIRSMQHAPALIIDLRGNQGGLLGMLSGLTGLLENKMIALGAIQSRNGLSPLYAFPQRNSYHGGLAILIDSSTESAAEMFASALQENGRAVIVGERSAGNTLPSSIMKLPTGALFQYGWANFQTTSGVSLEGNGVHPDVDIPLERRRLLSGVDSQLATAIVKAREQAKLNRIAGTPADDAPEQKSRELPAETKTETDSSTPPQPGPTTGPGTNASPETKMAADSPVATEIIQNYLKVIGGEQALRKISSRISSGSIEVPLTGLQGHVDIYEASPNKKTIMIDIPGYGVSQRTWDGARGWLEDPLQGFIDIGNSMYARLNTEADFLTLVNLKESGASLRLMGRLKVGERESFVIQTTYPGMVRQVFYFDTENGLLLRKDNVYYENYREVEGLKLPFTIRDESFSGFTAIIKLETIKHNIIIDDSKFKIYPSCFTNGAQN